MDPTADLGDGCDASSATEPPVPTETVTPDMVEPSNKTTLDLSPPYPCLAIGLVTLAAAREP